MADTEYDNGPEAYEKYLLNQQIIARWVDQTSQQQPLNPFTPAQADVYKEDYDSAVSEKELLRLQRVARWADNIPQAQLLNPFAPGTPPNGVIPMLVEDDYDLYRPSESSHRTSHRKNREQSENFKFDDRRSNAPTYIDIYHRSPSLASHPPTSLAQPTASPYRSQNSLGPTPEYIFQPSRQASTSSSMACLPSTSTTFLPQNMEIYPSERLSSRDASKSYGYHYHSGDIMIPPPVTYLAPMVVPAWPQPFDMATAPQLPYAYYPPPATRPQPPLLTRLFQGLTGREKSRPTKDGPRASRRTDSY